MENFYHVNTTADSVSGNIPFNAEETEFKKLLYT